MIEIDDTNQNDFLNDADKSGFDDDQESFRLGKFTSTSEIPSEVQSFELQSFDVPNAEVSNTEVLSAEVSNVEALNVEVQENESQFRTGSLSSDIHTSTSVVPSFDDEPLFPSRLARIDAPQQDDAHRNETMQDAIEIDDDGPSFEEISHELATAFPQNTHRTGDQDSNHSVSVEFLVDSQIEPQNEVQATSSSEYTIGGYSEDLSAQEYAPKQETVLDREALLEKRYQDQLRQEQEHAEAYLRGDLTDTHPEPQELSASEAQVSNNGASQFSPSINAQEYSGDYSSEYSPPIQFGTEESALHGMNNASSLPPLRVITIPDAEEQRRRDAEYAAAQKAKLSPNRVNTRFRDLVSASIFSLILAAIVAFGYIALRNTSLGRNIGTAWAKMSGQAPTALQDSLLEPVDVRQNTTQRDVLERSSDNPSTELQKSSGDTTTTSNSEQTVQSSGTAETSKSITQTQVNASAISSSAQNTAKNPAPEQSSQSAHSLAVNTTKPELKEQQPEQKKELPKEAKQQGEKKEEKNKGDTKQEELQKKIGQPTKTDVQKNTSAQTPTETKAQIVKQLPTNQPNKQNRSTALEQQSTQQISGVFAIQVYATPSLADAEEWLERLKQRGMMNPMITSQVIRGQTIYRVRFGLYNSLQEAEREAARQGYIGSWVVRLR